MDEKRHLFLYAKGWYPYSSNRVRDLKIICAHISSIDSKYVTERDVVEWLIESTSGWFARHTNRLRDLLLELHAGNTVVDRLYGYMQVMRPDEIGFELGDIDPELAKTLFKNC